MAPQTGGTEQKHCSIDKQFCVISMAQQTVVIQLQTQDGQTTGPTLDVPLNLTQQQLEAITNDLLRNVCKFMYMGVM